MCLVKRDLSVLVPRLGFRYTSESCPEFGRHYQKLGSGIPQTGRLGADFPARVSAVSVRRKIKELLYPQLPDDLLLFTRDRNKALLSQTYSLLSHNVAEIINDDICNQTNNNHQVGCSATQPAESVISELGVSSTKSSSTASTAVVKTKSKGKPKSAQVVCVLSLGDEKIIILKEVEAARAHFAKCRSVVKQFGAATEVIN